MSDAAGRCPACGAPLTTHLGGTLCAACLVTLALGEDDEDQEIPAAVPTHAYQLVSILSRREGRVRYLARRQDFHAFVSLEVIAAGGVESLGRTAIDARLRQLRLLRQPGIARILDAWVEPSGEWCLASDYLAGRAFPPREGNAACLAAFDRVCSILSEAHAQGVAHGLLDSESIVLVPAGEGVEPRVTGFTLVEPSPTIADDIAALARLLSAIAAGESFEADARALAAQATAGGLPTVAAFQAAVRTLTVRESGSRRIQNL